MSENNQLHFTVSAPGKVILHGEHAVVYGKPALAGVIGARNYLCYKETTADYIELQFKDLCYNVTVPLTKLNSWFIKIWEFNLTQTDKDESILLEEASNFVENSFADDVLKDERNKNALNAVFFLMSGIFNEKGLHKDIKGFEIKLHSGLRIGAGLGSSASFGVCVATTFLILAMHHSEGGIDSEIKKSGLSNEMKMFISRWAFNSEKLMHGKPSGVDNTVCTFGNIVKFSKGLPPVAIALPGNFPILLVHTSVSRSTLALVSKVAALKEEFPTLIDNVLNAMGEVVNNAVPIYETYTASENAGFNKIEKLFSINNNLLRAIGVSHPRLEQIFSISLKYGFSSKLTGAGGGGYAIVLLPPDYKESSQFISLCEDLKQNNFEFLETTVGGPGVQIHFH